MTEQLLLAAVGLLGLNALLLIILLIRQAGCRTARVESRLEGLALATERTERAVREEITVNRDETTRNARELREELGDGLQDFSQGFLSQLDKLTQNNERKLEHLRQTLEVQLRTLQQDNAHRLEQMRATVDEKLQATLERRLGESFRIVSERLELVHSGLGEMRTLAAGVGDLKKVLTNIKTRGCWGEIQLGNLLEQILTADQFTANIAVNPRTAERVEFAIRLPGRDDDGSPVWLPIDAKFPQEDYQRLLAAQDLGDADGVAAASAALEARIRFEGRKIRDKYICPPYTTDFAIMFLPTEGLFAEVLRRPGLCDNLLRECRVVLSGPTTLAALLNSLQMGFRTLAIEQRSSEVWAVLGTVKTEFGRFGEALEKVKRKLEEAGSSIDQAATRSRVLERKLRGVQDLPAGAPVPVENGWDDGHQPELPLDAL